VTIEAPYQPTMMERVLLAGVCAHGEIVLVRHAQQAANDLGDPARPKGGDAPLSELGLRQADAVADELSLQPVDAVWCSPLQRAHETARRIAAKHGLEPVIDERLVEVGVYRGLPRGATVRGELGLEGEEAVGAAFGRTRTWASFPLSESRDEVGARLGAVFDTIRSENPDSSRVVVVCHGGIVNAVIRQVVESDQDMLFYPAHASISRIARADGRLALSTANEMHYLRGRSDVAVTF
jgi:2,3-bisphosphoglycerate-dependent phosphoglycerate mutase